MHIPVAVAPPGMLRDMVVYNEMVQYVCCLDAAVIEGVGRRGGGGVVGCSLYLDNEVHTKGD